MDQFRERFGHNNIPYEKLVEEIERLDNDNDNLRNANFKNAEVSIKKESVLKNLVESLRKEVDELKSTNLAYKLEEKNKELLLKIEDLESNKRTLETTIESNEKTFGEMYNEIHSENTKLKTEIINLKLENTEFIGIQFKLDSILTCEECDKIFKKKDDFKDHILTIHQEYRFECDICGECSKTDENLSP